MRRVRKQSMTETESAGKTRQRSGSVDYRGVSFHQLRFQPPCCTHTERDWVPACRFTVVLMVCQFCQPPVLGMVVVCRSVPSRPRITMPPVFGEATLYCRL